MVYWSCLKKLLERSADFRFFSTPPLEPKTRSIREFMYTKTMFQQRRFDPCGYGENVCRKPSFLLLEVLILVAASVLCGASASNEYFSFEANHLSRQHVSPSLLYESSSSPFSPYNDKGVRTALFRDAVAVTTRYTPSKDYCSWKDVNRGGGFGLSSLVPSGYNPFGYKITELGERFLDFDGSLDSDVGRFLASARTRKRFDDFKSQWLEIFKISKKEQCTRISENLKELIAFCLKAGFLD